MSAIVDPISTASWQVVSYGMGVARCAIAATATLNLPLTGEICPAFVFNNCLNKVDYGALYARSKRVSTSKCHVATLAARR